MFTPEDPIIPTEEPAPKAATEASAAAVRARRRRATRQQLFPADAEGQAALITSLSRRAYPSLELFVFSLVCGAIVGLGFALDSQAVLLLGILVTPIMTPWIGFLLAIMTGSPRLLFETLMALLISGVIVFFGGVITGFAVRPFLPITFSNVFIHARLWIPALVVLSISSIIFVVSFARSEDKPFLPSILIAYSFYLPITAGGFGLGSGVAGIWPEGLYIFFVHFALASALGLITLFFLKLRPSGAGIVMSGFALLLLIGVLVILMSGGISPAPQAVATITPTIFIPSPIPSETPSATLTPTNTLIPSNTPSFTPTVTLNGAESITSTLTITLSPAKTLTATVTPQTTPLATFTAAMTPTITPTSKPVTGVINSDEGGGANLRQTPNGKFILTLDNGTSVEIQSDSRNVNGAQWLHIIVIVQGRRMEGWLLESVVSYDNPAQGITPSP